MQDVLIHEKGKEALKKLNIREEYRKKVGPPAFDMPHAGDVKQEKKKNISPPKIKKTLAIEKDPKKPKINITTTIIKEDTSGDGPKRKQFRKRSTSSKSRSASSKKSS